MSQAIVPVDETVKSVRKKNKQIDLNNRKHYKPYDAFVRQSDPKPVTKRRRRKRVKVDEKQRKIDQYLIVGAKSEAKDQSTGSDAAPFEPEGDELVLFRSDQADWFDLPDMPDEQQVIDELHALFGEGYAELEREYNLSSCI